MIEILRNKKSIAYRLAVTIVVFVSLQSVLWLLLLLGGGILTTTRTNAYEFFGEKVSNRRNDLEAELNNRREAIKPYIKQLSEKLEVLGDSKIPMKEDQDLFFEEVASILSSAIRTTSSTGAFVILNDNISRQSVHSALYLRDYDPFLNSRDENDIFMTIGSSEISRKLGIPLDINWSYTLTLNEDNKGFYYTPYENSAKSSDSDLLGYFSMPFSLTPDESPIITYSVPIYDEQGRVRGVAGIELSIDFVNKMLPAEELNPRGALGYLIGKKEKGHDGIKSMTMGNAYQEHILDLDNPFELERKDKALNIFLIKNKNIKEDIYACVEKINLYQLQTPYEQEEWYLIGMEEGDTLLTFYHSISRILRFTSIVCFFLSLVFSVAISYYFTRPIRTLAKRVRESDVSGITSLGQTNISEIDDLSCAIETVSRNFLDTANKMSQIIELVNVPIGAFEYRTDTAIVFATDRLWEILELTKETTQELQNKEMFIKRLHIIMDYPEPEEDNIYKINTDPPKWVKIETVTSENTTLGIATDVTEEIEKKKEIKKERDYDALTGLRKRNYFQQCVENHLKQKSPKQYQAMLMIDLDCFKTINDTYGHDIGDQYLIKTAELLQCFDSNQVISGRRSGDEFYLFFFAFNSKEEIRDTLRAIYKHFRTNPFVFPDHTSKAIAFSSGICWCEGDTTDYEGILNMADTALYKAKNDNKGALYEEKT